MGRPSKNPDHPITRLRQALSTDTYEMTREAFAKRYGFSAPSIKAIETGKYKLTPEVAARISAATGVLAQSLLENHDPLLAWDGKTFTAKTEPIQDGVSDEELETLQFLLHTAVKAARWSGKRDKSNQILVLFQEWLHNTIDQLGIEKGFQEQLLVALATAGAPGLYDSVRNSLVNRHKPSAERLRTRWEERKRLLEEEIAKGVFDLKCSLLDEEGERFRELERKRRSPGGLRLLEREELKEHSSLTTQAFKRCANMYDPEPRARRRYVWKIYELIKADVYEAIKQRFNEEHGKSF